MSRGKLRLAGYRDLHRRLRLKRPTKLGYVGLLFGFLFSLVYVSFAVGRVSDLDPSARSLGAVLEAVLVGSPILSGSVVVFSIGIVYLAPPRKGRDKH